LFKKYNENRYRKKGQKLLSSGDAKKAKHFFLKSISINSSVENLFNLALSHMALLQYSKAEDLLIKIYKEFPENELNGLALMECLLIQRKWKDSESISSQLIKNIPESTPVRYFSKIISDVILREKYVSAKENIHKAFQEIDSGSKDKALDFFLQAERHLPTNSEILNNIGILYFEKSEFEKAYKYFENALTLSQSDIRIQKNLIRTKKKLGSGKH